MVSRKLVATVAVALALAGCAQIKPTRGTQVDDLQVARLPPSALSEVNQKRADVDQAKDQVSRAEVEVRDAEAQLKVAEGEVKVAKEQEDTANKALEAAQNTRDQDGIAKAQQDIDQFEQKAQVADMHVKAEKAQVQLMKDRKQVTEKKLDMKELELEQAKYHALRGANDPAATEYSQSKFDEAFAKMQRELRDAETKVEQGTREVARARDDFMKSRQRYEAAIEGTPRG